MKEFCVIGWPLKHSLSPTIHNAIFKENDGGLSCIYRSVPVEVANVAEIVKRMRSGATEGMNVTIPYKETVVDLVDELDETAAAIHAVNTLAIRPGGIIKGYSTDGEGLLRAIERNAGVDPTGKVVAVLGAGGAARSAIHALAGAQVAKVIIVNRTRARAEEATSLSPVCVVGSEEDLDACDIIVNATSVGMDSDESPISAKHLHAGQLVVDAVYSPLETRLLREAKVNGAATLDGLWMLIHQACIAQAIWFGKEPDPQVMRDAAVRELEARAK